MRTRRLLLGALAAGLAFGLAAGLFGEGSAAGTDSDSGPHWFGYLFLAFGAWHMLLGVLLARELIAPGRLLAQTSAGQLLVGLASALFGTALVGQETMPEALRWLVELVALVTFYVGGRREGLAYKRRNVA